MRVKVAVETTALPRREWAQIRVARLRNKVTDRAMTILDPQTRHIAPTAVLCQWTTRMKRTAADVLGRVGQLALQRDLCATQPRLQRGCGTQKRLCVRMQR